ncbi:MAG: gamma-glutamyltransferase [Acidobacteriota bacterium]|nr:gamma-glutamyltransferase [Acidobacteriota bacterium]
MGRGLVEGADLTLNRRTLLAAAAGGAAMAIGCAPGSEPGGSAPAAVNGWTPPDDEARRALVGTARFGPKQAVRSANGIAICTHPLASAAAADMLALGGNACDGVLAASIAQAVVEPHMTTLSGCLSMLYYDAASGEYTYVNGMMAAPQAVPDVRNMDVAEFGALMTKTDGTLCFVPGFWGGFEAGLERHGLLPRATVMAPAIHYARDGFEIHPFLWGEMFVESAVLGREPFSREIYFDGGTLRDIGDKLVQSELADTLDRLAEDGGDHFYRGEFGRRYAETVQARGGLITADDMAAYEAFWDEPVQGTYRDYGVVGSPAPDFGGQALVEIMNMVELLDLQQAGPAFESGETTLEGRPASPNDRYEALGVAPPPPPGSNHVTVVDAAGNVATVLHSVMSMPFRTGIYVDGVYACASGVHLGSGPVEPGGRAHARICPNMFTRDGKPVLASGSPSVSLTENIVQNTTNLLDFGLDLESSVHKPRFGGSSMSVPGALIVEADLAGDPVGRLEDAGATVEVVNPWNWLCGSFEGVLIEEDGAVACGDPRRTARAVAV